METLKRGAVEGDHYVDGAAEDKRVYLWRDGEWLPGFSLTSYVTRDIKVSALDASTKSYPTVISAAAGGGGSGTGG